MPEETKTPWYVSSSGSGLSSSIMGFSVVGIGQGISLALRLFDIEISETEIAEFIIAGMGVVGSFMVAFGLLRKMVYRVKSQLS